jgi:hypothetical protein
MFAPQLVNQNLNPLRACLAKCRPRYRRGLDGSPLVLLAKGRRRRTSWVVDPLIDLSRPIGVRRASSDGWESLLRRGSAFGTWILSKSSRKCRSHICRVNRALVLVSVQVCLSSSEVPRMRSRGPGPSSGRLKSRPSLVATNEEKESRWKKKSGKKTTKDKECVVLRVVNDSSIGHQKKRTER